MIHTLHRKFIPWPKGKRVWWDYRSTIGHGEIDGVETLGTTHATTRYRVREFDHHPGESAIVIHFGSALHAA